MKIFSIVVYPMSDDGLFAATLSGQSSHETEIKSLIHEYADWLMSRLGYHSLKSQTRAFYYAHVRENIISVVAVDMELDEKNKRALLIKVDTATCASDLQKLLADPERAIITEFDAKIVSIHKEIQAVKEITFQNIEKILDRGERIEALVKRTEDLAIESDGFRKAAVDLKHGQRCPSLFSLFKGVRDFFWGSSYSYTPEQTIVKPNSGSR